MFKSEASDFNIVDFTPFGRDVLDELARACRKYDMKLGFYYSQAQDWNNPGGSVARKVMSEGWPNPDSTRIDAYTAAHNGAWDPVQTSRGMEEYIEKVSLPQVRELLSNYGDVAIIWWDTPTRMTDEFAAKFAAELAKHPQIITNDRLKRPNYPGDYKTPEGRVPKAEDIEGVDWETCMNIGSSWGFKSWEAAWKTPETLIRNLVTIAARGGNYLLNVGPTPEGEIPAEAVERLNAMGEWMKVNGEAIYGTERGMIYPAWGECIRKDNKRNTTLYLAVFEWPADGKLTLDVEYTPKKASLLAGGQKLSWEKTAAGVVIEVPPTAPDPIATIIKLDLREKLPYRKIVSNSEKTFEILDL
jgi:alpha-L-fucosidase